MGENATPDVSVALLTGGGDRHYAFGLAMGLVAKGVAVDFIGGDEVDSPEMHETPRLTYFNLRRNGRRDVGYLTKVARVLSYYARLIGYAASAKPKTFHILWNNKFEVFDRTLLMLYYKLLGKRLVLTAHNVNAGTRDGTDSWLNRLTLRCQYRLCDHVFVHTDQMKAELVEQFGVDKDSIGVIRYGLNNAVPDTALTPAVARRRIGAADGEKAILFFGNIAAYKGLEHLIGAFEQLTASGGDYRLIVVGRAKSASDPYVSEIANRLGRAAVRERTTVRMEFIPDEDVELYFKAADVAVLPYTHIFQSGVLFLAYSFGLPVIVTDVGSLREDVAEGETGFVCQPADPIDLAHTIERYFSSSMYGDLERTRERIRMYAKTQHSWDAVGEQTRKVYATALKK